MTETLPTAAGTTYGEPTTLLQILYVEDDLGDVLLTKEALAHTNPNALHVVQDGVEAWEFLRCEGKFVDAPCPDLILLDLNMPRMDGREFLEKIKEDECFNAIPVVVFTTSDADQDILKSYQLQASCFVTKPIDLQHFTQALQSIHTFWSSVAKVPLLKN